MRNSLKDRQDITGPVTENGSEAVLVDPVKGTRSACDLLLPPNQRHGCGDASNDTTRRPLNYVVRYLLNVEPPKESVPVPARQFRPKWQRRRTGTFFPIGFHL
jgi:hypothetical protein